MKHQSQFKQSGHRRAGAAAVELAVCLPTIVLLVLASIESCNMIFLDQSLSVASYEGIRVAIQSDATSAEAIARCQDLLGIRHVASGSITLDPADVSTAESGEHISVTVSAPCSENAILPPLFFGGRTLASRSTMVKE